MLSMAQSKKPASAGPRTKSKVPTPAPTRADGRPKSKLTLAGEAGALAAKRELLLKTLVACGWNLSRTAEELEMPGASQVIRAIRDVGLDAEYEAARKRGDISHGTRS